MFHILRIAFLDNVEIDKGKVAILLTVDKKRDGNSADVQRLLPLLKKWGYGEIINKRDVKKQEMIDTLCDLQKRSSLHSVTKISKNLVR